MNFHISVETLLFFLVKRVHAQTIRDTSNLCDNLSPYSIVGKMMSALSMLFTLFGKFIRISLSSLKKKKKRMIINKSYDPFTSNIGRVSPMPLSFIAFYSSFNLKHRRYLISKTGIARTNEWITSKTEPPIEQINVSCYCDTLLPLNINVTCIENFVFKHQK